jgi:hypothetical protein
MYALKATPEIGIGTAFYLKRVRLAADPEKRPLGRKSVVLDRYRRSGLTDRRGVEAESGAVSW